MTRRWVAILALVGVAYSVSNARADRIAIRGGSFLKGKAIIDESRPDTYLIFGLQGKTPVVMKKERIAAIDPEPSILDEYAVQRKALLPKQTAEADFELGFWCDSNKLRDLATVHFESAIKRDPSFAPAHVKLGHVEHAGKWLTPSELKLAQGYTLYRGKWITAEEKEQKDAEASATADQKSWSRRLAILKQAILNGPDNRRQDAEAQLFEIKDIAAAGPIVRAFGLDAEPTLRVLCAKALGGIPGPEASSALVTRFLAESEESARMPMMEILAKSKEPNIIPKLTLGLSSKSVPVVNRAAWALANLNATKAVPKLIPALISTRYEVVWIQRGAGYGGMADPGPGLSISGGQSIPVLSGPVVGNGVVAFGSASVPITSYYSNAGSGVGSGGRSPIPTYVPIKQQNVEVWGALVKLTGQDFGYDVTAWRKWVSTAYHPDPSPSKRVPQP